MNPHEQSLAVAAESAAARPQRQCTIKNNKENKETTKKNNTKTTTKKKAGKKKAGKKKEEGQMAGGTFDLALVSKEDAFEMAKKQQLSWRNYIYLGDAKRFNFGCRCVNRPGNNCNCSSTGILNACIRASAMGALAADAVPGVTYTEKCTSMAAAGTRAIEHSSTGMGCGPMATRANMAQQNGGFPIVTLVNGVTNEKGEPITQFQEATSEHGARIAICSSEEEGDCVTKALMKELKVGGKNLETMTNPEAIAMFAGAAHWWGLRAIQPDGYIGKGPKPAGWQYKAQFYEAREGYVLTQNIDMFDSRLPTKKEAKLPAAKRSRLSVRGKV